MMTEKKVKYCSQCGKELPNNTSDFCPHCGVSLNQTQPLAIADKNNTTPPNKKRRELYIAICVVVALTVIIAGSGFGYWMYSKHRHSQAVSQCTDSLQQLVDLRHELEQYDDWEDYQVTDSTLLDSAQNLLNEDDDLFEQADQLCATISETRTLEAVIDRIGDRTLEFEAVASELKESVKDYADYTLSDIQQATTDGDFRPIAGEYCQNSGRCVTLKNDGTLLYEINRPEVGNGNDKSDPLGPDRSQTKIHNTVDESYANTVYDKGLGITFSGPDEDYQCRVNYRSTGRGIGWDQCQGAPQPDFLSEPVSVTYYVKGAGPKIYEVAEVFGTPPDKDTWPKGDRPFLRFFLTHGAVGFANEATDNTVWYLKE